MKEIEFIGQDPLSKNYPNTMPKSKMQGFIIKIGLAKTERSATVVLLILSLVMLSVSAFIFINATNPNILRTKQPSTNNTSGKTFQDFLKERQVNRNQP